MNKKSVQIMLLCVISDFRRGVNENFALLGYYAASSDNFLQTFRHNLSVSSSLVQSPKLLTPEDRGDR
jgi:hypothetical protein